MKILTAKQIKEWDQYTIKNEPITSLKLMERAAEAFVHWFVQTFDKDYNIAIVCGTGNNGGDGLAIGRILSDKKIATSVFVVNPEEGVSKDFHENEARLQSLTTIHYIKSKNNIPDFSSMDLIIDGIFGSGLSRHVEGIYKEVIEAINSSNAKVIAIDIPSGLFADKNSTEGTIVEADYTLTFQTPKLAFFLPQNHKYIGKWEAVDIGLNQSFLSDIKSNFKTISEKQIAGFYKERQNFTHKGNYGKCLLVCGSYGKMGAAVLAAMAALRAGTGLLTVHVPRHGYNVIQTAVPEAMASPDKDEKYFTTPPDTEGFDAIGIGPGLGTDELTLNAYAELLSHYKKPMVIDADALNLLAKNHHLLDMVPPHSILTPHFREFERIAGETNNDFERLEKLKEYAVNHNFYIVLKGYHTAIATPEGEIFFNTTGNPGMATGGTGDVLTGIITALLGQNYSTREAVLLGVWLHGLAGDLAAEEIGMESMIASDLVRFLPKAFKYLRRIKNL